MSMAKISPNAHSSDNNKYVQRTISNHQMILLFHTGQSFRS